MVGLDLLILLSDMTMDASVLLPLRTYFSMLIFADLIVSEERLCGMSARGIDALTPEAVGSSPFICASIREVMRICAESVPPAKRAKAEAAKRRARYFLFI
jgi:hypothetical protein